jgi:hypothetical protein
MAKNICSDGTGQTDDGVSPSNVARLCSLLDLKDREQQDCCYDPGVGTPPGPEVSPLRSKVDCGWNHTRDGMSRSSPSSWTPRRGWVAPSVVPATTPRVAIATYVTRYAAAPASSTWLLTWVTPRRNIAPNRLFDAQFPARGRKCSLPDGDQSHINLFIRQSQAKGSVVALDLLRYS